MNVLCFKNIYPSAAEPSAGCLVRDQVDDRALDVDVQVLGCSIVPRDPIALSDAILHAFATGRDPALRQRVERFSRRRVEERKLALYESVLGRAAI
jgi:hypothetical protein